jgi:hypothetical protein
MVSRFENMILIIDSLKYRKFKNIFVVKGKSSYNTNLGNIALEFHPKIR